MRSRGHQVVALTHVCQAWREVFISRVSLWTNFDCVGADRTRIYLERSKSSPINLSLCKYNRLSPHDPFFQITPHAIGRFKSLSIEGTPRNIRDITTHLSRPAPLLETMLIHGGRRRVSRRSPALTSALFNGDLSSLRELHLRSVRTELPWRDMTNLTSFALARTSPVSISQLLDFFESTPHLREVELRSATTTSDAQNGRLVPLTCLKRMEIAIGGPSSVLLDHLRIPVGTRLTTRVGFLRSLIEDHLPRSLDDLRNLPDFKKIHLYDGAYYPRMRLSGPNGQIRMISVISPRRETCLMLGSLAQFNTSKTERLDIVCGNPPSAGHPYQALLPMKNLRTLTISWCESPYTFIHALDPRLSSSRTVVCPKLEELVLVLCVDGEVFGIQYVVGMVVARALRGAKLNSLRIVSQREFPQVDILQLKKHISHVECGPEADGVDEDGYDSYDSNNSDDNYDSNDDYGSDSDSSEED